MESLMQGKCDHFIILRHTHLPLAEHMSHAHVLEARVLIVMTGGTICMQQSPNGLIPARNFLERCMAPRPEFNDGETHPPVEVRFHDGADGLGELHSLRTPTSVYGKRIRYVEYYIISSKEHFEAR